MGVLVPLAFVASLQLGCADEPHCLTSACGENGPITSAGGATTASAGGAGGTMMAAGGAGGEAEGGGTSEGLPDFSLEDVNATSPTYGQPVSPKDYLMQVSAWYFAHAT